MTVGKDVSGLFPDVLKNMQTEDLEQKKLVYLYLMNYAKTQPELVILAVNTFVKVRDPIIGRLGCSIIANLEWVLSCRIPMIPTLLFEPWLSGRWGVSALKR